MAYFLGCLARPAHRCPTLSRSAAAISPGRGPRLRGREPHVHGAIHARRQAALLRGRSENLANSQTASFHTANPRLCAHTQAGERAQHLRERREGFRSGGFNSAATQPAYDPETVWTYELGAKMGSTDGRLSADLAVFCSDYTDYQINGIRRDNITAGSITSNAGSARLKGVEWSVSWRPARGGAFSFSGNQVELEVLRDRRSKLHARGGRSARSVPEGQLLFLARSGISHSTAARALRASTTAARGVRTYRDPGNGPNASMSPASSI